DPLTFRFRGEIDGQGPAGGSLRREFTRPFGHNLACAPTRANRGSAPTSPRWLATLISCFLEGGLDFPGFDLRCESQLGFDQTFRWREGTFRRRSTAAARPPRFGWCGGIRCAIGLGSAG